MKTESIKCDSCQRELATRSPYPAVYSFQLSAINVNINNTGKEFDVHVKPPISYDHHFCTRDCISDWINGRMK